MIDELELVRNHRPPTTPPDPAHLAVTRAELLASLTPEDRRPTVVRHRRGGGRRWWVAPIAAAVAVGLSAAGWVALTGRQNPRTEQTIECGTDSYVPVGSGNPVADCRGFWAAGGHRVPDLVAWVDPTGLIVVLPRGQRPPAGSRPLPVGFRQDRAVLYVNDELADVTRGLSAHCFSRAAAEALTRADLRLAGLGSWAVVVDDHPGTPACAQYLPDVAAGRRAVTLFGMAGTFSPMHNALTELSSALDDHLAGHAGPGCDTDAQAAALVRQEAAALHLPNSGLVVSQAGPLDGRRPTCARATIDPAGGVDVVIWLVPVDHATAAR